MKNHVLLSILVFSILALPLVSAWYPYGNNIFQNQIEDATGSWSNQTEISTTTNTGIDTPYQPLTADIDGDGQIEIVIADGDYIKIINQTSLIGETELSVGTISGQPYMANLDPDEYIEIVVTATKGGIAKLYEIQWDGTTLSNTQINYTEIDRIDGASPKCWYQTGAGLFAENKPFCMFRTYNDTYILTYLSNKSYYKYSWNGTNTSNPSIPILANINDNEDANAIPEFVIVRGWGQDNKKIEVAVLTTDTIAPDPNFRGSGGILVGFILNNSDGGDGLAILNFTGDTFGSTTITTASFRQTLVGNPILYDNDASGGYEILITAPYLWDYTIPPNGYVMHGTELITIDTDGGLEWSVSQALPPHLYEATASTSISNVTQPLVDEFTTKNTGDEICYLFNQDVYLTGSETPDLSKAYHICRSIGTGDELGGLCQTNQELQEENNLSLALGTSGRWTNGYATSTQIDSSGSREYITGIGVIQNFCESGASLMINSVTDLGLGTANKKAPIPTTDNNGNTQLLYSNSQSPDTTGTSYYTVSGLAGNNLPSITGVTTNPTSQTTTIGTPVQFTISGTDPESDPLYTAKRCKATDSATAYSYTNTQTCTYTTAGSFTARLYLTDDQHLTNYDVYTDIQINVSSTSIYCGNGVCDGNETTETCSIDCATGTITPELPYQIGLQKDLVNVNAPFDDASQQGLLGNIYLGMLEFFSKTMLPIFFMFIIFLVFLIVFTILAKIQSHL